MGYQSEHNQFFSDGVKCKGLANVLLHFKCALAENVHSVILIVWLQWFLKKMPQLRCLLLKKSIDRPSVTHTPVDRSASWSARRRFFQGTGVGGGSSDAGLITGQQVSRAESCRFSKGGTNNNAGATFGRGQMFN